MVVAAYALLVEPGVAKFIAEWFRLSPPFDHSRVDIALTGLWHGHCTRHMGSGPRAEQFVFGNSEQARHLQRLIAHRAHRHTGTDPR